MHPMVTPVKKKTPLTPTVMMINKVAKMKICHQMAPATKTVRKKSKKFL